MTRISIAGSAPKEPTPPLPSLPKEKEEQIPVPPSDIVPEPIQLPSDDNHKAPIDEVPKEPKIYM
jgi:hypothetical protein